MGIEEVTAVKDVHNSEMEEEFVMWRGKSRENQSTAAEKESSGTCGISRDAGHAGLHIQAAKA